MANFLILFLKKINALSIKNERKIYINHLKRKLKYKNFTLITNNCIGGIIYHKLGLRFNSPTINFYFPNDYDFLTFVNNLEEYVNNAELVEEKNNFDFPVGVLKSNKKFKDITIHFIHDTSFEYVKSKWEERKKRIIKDKIIVIFDLSFPPYPHIDEQRKIEEFKNLKYPKILFIRNEKKPHFVDENIFSFKVESQEIKVGSWAYSNRIKTYLEQFDYISFINESIKNYKNYK